MMFRVNTVLLFFFLTAVTFRTEARNEPLTIEVSTGNSLLIVDNDTTLIQKPGNIEIELSLGTHEIQNRKEGYVTKTEVVNMTSAPYKLKFEALIEIPSLSTSEKRLILNEFNFNQVKSTWIKSYNSKSRFESASPKARKYSGNLAQRMDQYGQQELINRFMLKHDLVEDQEVHGFAITENNVNLDIEITSLLLEEYRSDMERYSFECKFRLLDLKLVPFDSANFVCLIENDFGRIEAKMLTDLIVEKLCIYVNNASWKGLLNADDAPQKENKKFNLQTTKTFGNYVDARKAVVTVVTDNGHGSGCVLTNSGVVVTNAHVIKGSETVEVITFFGDTIEGKVEDYNPIADLAIVQLEDSVDFAFKLSKSNEPIVVGQKVYAIGSPLSPLLSQSISNGIISTQLLLNGVYYLQTDAKVNSGNSGGALVDENGNLLGIVNAKIVDFSVEGISFAIPASEILIHFSNHE
jgi:hypothetical protein